MTERKNNEDEYTIQMRGKGPDYEVVNLSASARAGGAHVVVKIGTHEECKRWLGWDDGR